MNIEWYLVPGTIEVYPERDSDIRSSFYVIPLSYSYTFYCYELVRQEWKDYEIVDVVETLCSFHKLITNFTRVFIERRRQEVDQKDREDDDDD